MSSYTKIGIRDFSQYSYCFMLFLILNVPVFVKATWDCNDNIRCFFRFQERVVYYCMYFFVDS
jgi:hypothetical protein